MTAAIRVGVVDDHPGVRAGIIRLLRGAKDIRVIGEGANGEAAIALARAKKPDLMLLDVELPDLRGDVVMGLIRDALPAVKVLSVSSYSDREHVRIMVDNGADGYITKDEAPGMLLEAIRIIARDGQKWVSPKAMKSARQIVVTEQNLTEREARILEQIRLDRSEKQIAAALGLDEQLVARYVRLLLKKFDAESVAALRAALMTGDSVAGARRPAPLGKSPKTS